MSPKKLLKRAKFFFQVPVIPIFLWKEIWIFFYNCLRLWSFSNSFLSIISRSFMAYFPIKTKNERKIVLIKPTSDNTLLKKKLIVFFLWSRKILGVFWTLKLGLKVLGNFDRIPQPLEKFETKGFLTIVRWTCRIWFLLLIFFSPPFFATKR